MKIKRETRIRGAAVRAFLRGDLRRNLRRYLRRFIREPLWWPRRSRRGLALLSLAVLCLPGGVQAAVVRDFGGPVNVIGHVQESTDGIHVSMTVSIKPKSGSEKISAIQVAATFNPSRFQYVNREVLNSDQWFFTLTPSDPSTPLNYRQISAVAPIGGLDVPAKGLDVAKFTFKLASGQWKDRTIPPDLSLAQPVVNDNLEMIVISGITPGLDITGVVSVLGGPQGGVNTFYVDRDLNPANGGTGDCPGNYDPSLRACAASGSFIAVDTLQEAANIASPGATVYIKPGLYQPVGIKTSKGWTGFYIHKSGLQEKPIRFVSEPLPVHDSGTGLLTEPVIIDGQGTFNSCVLIEAAHVEIVGLTIINSGRYGLLIQGAFPGLSPPNNNEPTGPSTTHNIVVDRCTFRDHDNGSNRQAVAVFGSEKVLIKRSIAYRCNAGFGFGMNSLPSPTIINRDSAIEYSLAFDIYDPNNEGENGNAFFFSGHNRRMRASHNVSHDNSDNGFSNLSVFDSVFEHNVAYNTNSQRSANGDGEGIKVGVGIGINNLIRFNIVFNNHHRGFDDATSRGNVYYHNVAFDHANDAGLFSANDSPLVFNNIFYKSNGTPPGSGNDIVSIPIDPLERAQFQNNLVTKQVLPDVVGHIVGDPIFVDAANNNKRTLSGGQLEVNVDVTSPDFGHVTGLDLGPGSPAIDAGRFLTTVAVGGSSLSRLVVNDDPSKLFRVGDVIQVDNSNQDQRTVLSIDGSNNSIAVSPEVDVAVNAGVSMPWKGDKPDIGAYEVNFGGAQPSLDPATTIFVDNLLMNDCVDQTYSISSRDCSASPGSGFNAFLTPQDAADASQPGFRVIFREGTYIPTKPGPECNPIMKVTTSGTSAEPISFETYQKADGRYEEVLFDVENRTNRAIWVSGANYITVDGFILTHSRRQGISLGKTSECGGPPVHHVTVKNCIARFNGEGRPSGSKPGFEVWGASHDILFERCVSHDNEYGFSAGIPHGDDKSKNPYNITFRYCLAHHNIKTNGGGIKLAGAYNSVISHCVSHSNADSGFGSQGPFADNNIFEYNVAFNQRKNPDGNGGTPNERGAQIANVNNCFLQGRVCGSLNPNGITVSGGNDNLFHHNILFDNGSRGWVDPEGSDDGKYFNNIAFRNSRDGRQDSWGILLESRAGESSALAVTKGATLKNSISYFNAPSADLAARSTKPHQSVYESDHNFIGDGRFVSAIYNNPAFDQHSLSGDPQFNDPGHVQVDTNLYLGDPALRIPNDHFGVVDGLDLLPGSPAIDAGAVIPGLHCATADDDPQNPMDPNASCWHWMGKAPDMGVYEFGLPKIPPPSTLPSPPGDDPGLESNPIVETSGFRTFKNVFNPSKGEKADIGYQLEAAGPLSLIVYDREGREIRILANENASAVSDSKSWDGRNASGELVSSGVYLIVMKVDGTVFKKKVVVLK